MKVAITRKIPRAGIDLLKKNPQLDIKINEDSPLTEPELIEFIKDADAIIPVIPDQITKHVMEAAGDNLKLIAHYAVGYDNIDVASASEKGIYVSNTPGDLTESVAEFSLALMMTVGKNIVQADKYMREDKYKYWDPMIFLGTKLMGKTLGLVGFGRIGQYLANICKRGFNMRVVYYDNQRNEKAEIETGAMFTSLDDLLGMSDFVSLHVPLLPSTHHLIGDKELRKMKPTAYLINTARGPVIDEEALYHALKDKCIEGAALDVFEEEPKMFDGLKDLDNVVVSPHIASATREARIQMARMAAENVIEVLINKKPPVNLVNMDVKFKGY